MVGSCALELGDRVCLFEEGLCRYVVLWPPPLCASCMLLAATSSLVRDGNEVISNPDPGWCPLCRRITPSPPGARNPNVDEFPILLLGGDDDFHPDDADSRYCHPRSIQGTGSEILLGGDSRGGYGGRRGVSGKMSQFRQQI